MTRKFNSLFLAILLTFIFIFVLSSKNEVIHKLPTLNETKTKMWASMALCWGENIDNMGSGRKKKEYNEAALLSSKLLADQSEGYVSVIVTIVHEDDEPSEDLKQFEERLKYPGVYILFEKVKNKLKCSSQAQLTRMYVFKHDFIEDNDIVFTVDVDAFIIGDKIIESFLIPHQVWISEYSHTQTSGETFNMNFVAMLAKVWRKVLNFEDLGVRTNLEDHFTFFSAKTSAKYWGMWGLDQVILTYALLRPGHQLCSLPEDNPLWKGLKLTPSNFDDIGICYHGDFMNCNIEVPKMRGGCPWWHFYPKETKEDMKKVYNKVVNNTLSYTSTDLNYFNRLFAAMQYAINY